MSRESFLKKNRSDWAELSELTEKLSGRDGRNVSHEDLASYPTRYRKACRDHAIAEHRMYGLAITDRLNKVIQNGYQVLYKGRGKQGSALHFFLVRLPALVRANHRLLWLSTLLFFGPFIAMMLSYKINPDWIYSMVSPAEIETLEASYGANTSIEDLNRERGGNFRMFGFYIYNNISIDFRIFAGGILACIGTIFFTLFNGVKIGAMFGYVHMEGNPETLWNFCCGHSSFELIGMLLSAMAGFRLGLAIIRPGTRTRRESLRVNMRDTIHLVYGAAILTFMAAIVEGFWSANPIPPTIKYTFAILMWVLLFFYFTFAGRGHEH